MKNLQKHGSFRLASERANAAMILADMTEHAATSIPLLRQRLADEDLRVQVWAHYALAKLEGDVESHEDAVRGIHNQHNAKDADGLYLEFVGNTSEGVLEKLAELRRERENRNS
ncbi:MAG: hypothetical protein K2X38_22195 [Gemmataceae bacterium]|nr:hypothetical protein [Gemmataceae bacterium]